VTKRSLNARVIAEEVRKGLHDNEIMRNHELSPAQLGKVYEKLLAANLIDESHLDGRPFWRTAQSSTDPPRPTEGHPPVSGVQSIAPGTCPRCGTPYMRRVDECPHCRVVFSRLEDQHEGSEGSGPQPRAYSRQDGGLSNETLAGYFYAEAEEVQEAKQKERRWIISAAIALAVLPFVFALFGYGKQIVLVYSLGLALFVFLYYMVVVYYAFRQGLAWGLLCLCFSPGAIVFVFLHWQTIFREKMLARVWLALFLPLTIMTLLAKYWR
jgi:hypothetical protein